DVGGAGADALNRSHLDSLGLRRHNRDNVHGGLEFSRMADETINVPVRLLVALGLAVVISFVGAGAITPPDPVSMLILALPCFVVQAIVNLLISRRLRSWSLLKMTALTVLVDCVIVLCAFGVARAVASL
ncbi:MAG TPA: hypothetical protein VMW48_20275, partial [Vicinamibacterales bacterium]|nr:hypothetical protein [Vicinamibacterales bacterium]